MTDETVYEAEEKRSRRGIANYLRRLAGAFSRGEPGPVDEEQTVTIDPPAEADFEVEIEQEDGVTQLELEMEWPEEEGAVDVEADASKATFERYEDSAEEWRWRLVHDNGNIIADGSEGYSSKQKLTQGIDSVRKNAPGAHVVDQSKDDDSADEEGGSSATFEIFEDSGGKWRWRLRHDNGEIIADGGQGYTRKHNAKKGLRSVKQNARGAPVEDVED